MHQPQTANTNLNLASKPPDASTAPPASATETFSAAKKKPVGYIVGMVICTLLAVAGVGFGVYGIISVQDKTTQLDQLHAKIAEQDKKLASLELNADAPTMANPTDDPATNLAKQNPVFSAPSPWTFTQYFTSGLYSYYGEGGYPNVVGRKVALSIRNGAIAMCDLLDENNRSVGGCSISGLSGRIYKAINAGAGQTATADTKVAFIMEDGTVAYFSYGQLESGNSYTIEGTLPINGFVRDSLEVNVNSTNAAGGYATTLFFLNDGQIVEYGDVFDDDVHQGIQ